MAFRRRFKSRFKSRGRHGRRRRLRSYGVSRGGIRM